MSTNSGAVHFGEQGLFFVSEFLHAVLGDDGVDQGQFLGLVGADGEAGAVAGFGGGEALGRAVEGGQALAAADVVAPLFVQDDAGGVVDGVALLFAPAPSSTLAVPIFSASLAVM